MAFFLDHFVATPGTDLENHVSDSGNTWVQVTSLDSTEIIINPSGVALPQNGATQYRTNFTTNSSSTEPIVFQVNFVANPSGVFPNIGIYFMASATADSGYCIRFATTSDGMSEFQWITFTAGTPSNISTTGDISPGLTPGHTYECVVSPNGSGVYTVTYRDVTAAGSPVSAFVSTDTTYSTGLLGLRCDGPLTTSLYALTALWTNTPAVITLSGPSSGTVNIPSGTMTATLDGPAPFGGISVALTVSGITGSFTSTPVVIPESSISGTFTFTPSSLGNGTITGASGGLTSGTLAYNSVAPQPTLSGPTTGTIYVPITYTVSQPASYNGTIIPSDNGSGGIITPERLIWNNTSQTQTFLYVPNKTGSISISITSSVGSVSGSPISLTVSTNAAKSALFAGPTVAGNSNIAGQVGVASGNFTVTPNGLYTGTVTPWDGGQGGTFTPSTLSFSNSATPQTFTYTPTNTGIITISIRTPGITSPGIFLIDSLPAAATSAVLTGPTTVKSGQTTLPFTIILNGSYQGTITLSDSSGGGTFFPSSKIIYTNPSNAPQQFSYTPALYTSQQTKTISISASPSLSISGSISVTVSPTTPITSNDIGGNPFYSPNALNN